VRSPLAHLPLPLPQRGRGRGLGGRWGGLVAEMLAVSATVPHTRLLIRRFVACPPVNAPVERLIKTTSFW